VSDEAAAFLQARRRPLEMVIFDCDGVLIDSEPLCNRVVAEILTADGWATTAEECERRFIGLSFYAMQPVVETHLGRALGDDWVDRVVAIVTEAMAREVEPMPGAREVLETVTALVIEDSVAGVTAARAAGMDCLGLACHGDGAALRAAGAIPIHSMHELSELLRAGVK
jgi:beta-phosphoglucomutase-like phosphatase (HAD superfamily)